MIMSFVLGLGITLILIGVALFMIPNQLARFSQFLNQKVFEDSTVLNHRRQIAIVCFIVGLMLLWFHQGHHLGLYHVH